MPPRVDEEPAAAEIYVGPPRSAERLEPRLCDLGGNELDLWAVVSVAFPNFSEGAVLMALETDHEGEFEFIRAVAEFERLVDVQDEGFLTQDVKATVERSGDLFVVERVWRRDDDPIDVLGVEHRFVILVPGRLGNGEYLPALRSCAVADVRDRYDSRVTSRYQLRRSPGRAIRRRRYPL